MPSRLGSKRINYLLLKLNCDEIGENKLVLKER